MKSRLSIFLYILILIQLSDHVSLLPANKQTFKLSPNSAMFLSDIKRDNIQSQDNRLKIAGYRISDINNSQYVGGLIKVKIGTDPEILKQKGVLIGTKAGNIWTAKIPVSKFEEICSLAEIEYIQIDEPLKPKLDEAIKLTYVDSVHLGSQLNAHPYKGKGVIIGMLDMGFDYKNPNFFDETGTKTRIIKVWDQNITTGTPPTGYEYGTEIYPEKFLQYTTDYNSESHGTHTSGIAGGSGYGLSKYQGVAPDAEFILVSVGGDTESDPQSIFTTGQSSLVDAISYVFSYAQSVGKPAVINMSLGTHIGPHDGTSLFDQACDYLAGAGKILVGSAGNEGGVTIHLAHQFNSTDDTFSTLLNDYGEYGGADIWGDTGTDFCFKVLLYDLKHQNAVDSTEWLCTKDIITSTDNSLSYRQKVCTLYIHTTNDEFNGKTRAAFYYDNPTGAYVLLKVKGTNGKINMWNLSDLDFFSYGINGLIDGDTQTSVGEIGGTGKSIITVGAYISKNKYTNLSEKVINSYSVSGIIAPFSSNGPTSDGRLKPDITAPGSQVVSSVNHLDMTMVPGGQYFSDVVEKNVVNNQTYYFAAFEGTSMSSPMVTGIAALMLEMNKNLTPDMIKMAISQTSIHDANTGNIPNYTWGYGKIDALSLMKYIDVTDVNDSNTVDILQVFPNPVKNELYIKLTAELSSNLNMQIMDFLGNIIVNQQLAESNNQLWTNVDMSNFANGYYFLKLISANQIYFSKIVVNH